MIKEDFSKILKEYQKLKNKTDFIAYEMPVNGPLEFQYIDPNDMIKKSELEDKLKGNLTYLSDEELKSLYSDNKLMDEAVRVLAKRKSDNK